MGSLLKTVLLYIAVVAISWVWVCIAAAICSVVRENLIPKSEAIKSEIFAGAYLEPKVSIVCAVFLGVGSGFFVSF